MRVLFKCTFGLYTLLKFRTKLVKNETKGLKGSYLILSNHTNNYDPIFYQAYIPRFIHFVIMDAVFRNAILRKLLNWFGYIKKRKAVSDATTIKNMIKIAREGGVIGLFPEGNRNWDGQTMPFSNAAARLVKMLGIPLVIGNIKGGYLTRPRWGDAMRRGKIEIALTLELTSEQIKKMSVDEIYKKLEQGLYQDDFAWQQEHPIRYKSARMAQDLELFIATCPCCKNIFTMHSKGNDFSCTSCGAGVKIDNYYNLIKDSKIPFETIRQWGDWQEKNIYEVVKNCGDEPALSHNEATLYKSETEKNYIAIADGTLVLYKDSLRFLCDNGEVKSFDMKELKGVCVQFRRGLAFYSNFTDYRVLFKSGKVSAYLWAHAMNLMADSAQEALALD